MNLSVIKNEIMLLIVTGLILFGKHLWRVCSTAISTILVTLSNEHPSFLLIVFEEHFLWESLRIYFSMILYCPLVGSRCVLVLWGFCMFFSSYKNNLQLEHTFFHIKTSVVNFLFVD
jgi:hypothetical protein